MNKISLPKIDFPQGAMEYPLCTDLLIAHLLARKGIDYSQYFSDCLDMQLNTEGESIDEVLRFPKFGVEKYTDILSLTKVVKENDADALTFIQNQIANNEPAVVHFDSYFCPWDVFYQKRHNDHVLFVTGISKRGKKCRLCDPYFGLWDKKIRTKQLLRGMRYYYVVTYKQSAPKEIDTDYIGRLKAFAETFCDFVRLSETRLELLKPETDQAFVSKLYLTLQKGRVNLYFYRLFLKARENRDLSEKLYEADCLWTNCLLYHIRGARSYYEPLEMLKRLRELSAFLSTLTTTKSEACKGDFSEMRKSTPIPLAQYMNCKMFLQDDEGEKSDFIENEKLSVTPKDSVLEVKGRKFRLYPDEEKDNVRCVNQRIDIPNSGKGISLLFVAEWIDAVVSLELYWEDGSTTQYRIHVHDFPKQGEKSVDIGEAYDLARWKAFDHVYANVADIVYPEGKRANAFRLPAYSHLHLLAAAVIE